MKDVFKKTMAVTIVTFLIGFLFCSFSWMSFDPNQWSQDGRNTLILISSSVAFLSLIVLGGNKIDEKKSEE